MFTAGSVLVELVEYLDPVGRPRPADTGSRIKEFSTSPSAPAAGATKPALPPGRAAGAAPNRKPVICPAAGVVYLNHPDQFSVELLWMSARSEKGWGFTATGGNRPKADTQAIEHTVRIAAPVQATWDAITEHETWPDGSVSARYDAPSTALRGQMVGHPNGC